MSMNRPINPGAVEPGRKCWLFEISPTEYVAIALVGDRWKVFEGAPSDLTLSTDLKVVVDGIFIAVNASDGPLLNLELSAGTDKTYSWIPLRKRRGIKVPMRLIAYGTYTHKVLGTTLTLSLK